MKTKTIYQCEYCLTEYKTSKEAYKCEASCLELTWDEYTEYLEMLTREKIASYILSRESNEETRKLFNDCIREVIKFQEKHGIIDSR